MRLSPKIAIRTIVPTSGLDANLEFGAHTTPHASQLVSLFRRSDRSQQGGVAIAREVSENHVLGANPLQQRLGRPTNGRSGKLFAAVRGEPSEGGLFCK
jgi:hypothetical protein